MKKLCIILINRVKKLIILAMSFLVTSACINCKFGDCIQVCPVDCFYEGDNMVVINPDKCIDCSLCETECPVNAIFSIDLVPTYQANFILINKVLSKVWKKILYKSTLLTPYINL